MSEPPRPRCTCHGIPVHVHPDNGKPDPHGRDPGRGWNWHCPLEDCAGYSRVLIVLNEWITGAESVTGLWDGIDWDAARDPSLPSGVIAVQDDQGDWWRYPLAEFTGDEDLAGPPSPAEAM